MTIGLAMLVRDEAATVAEMLETVRPLVSHWTIVDTGSKDKTVAVVRKQLKGIPGRVHKRPWVGFARNRTELLELARGTADYLLTLDADHRLHIDGELPELTEDEYLIRIRGDMEWRLPLLLKGDRAWRYEGVAHSYLAPDGPVTHANLDCLSIDGGPGATPEKLERDIKLLAAEHGRNPLDARTVFYLARSYDDLDQAREAIHFYRLRASMNGWEQERFYARYRLGVLLCETVSYWDGARELLAAAEMLPERAAEPLRALATAGNAVADKVAPPAEGLFVHRNAYREVAA